MNRHADPEEIRRTAAGLMAVLDVQKVGQQLVRLYGEQAVADALSPVAAAVRAGAEGPWTPQPVSLDLAELDESTEATEATRMIDLAVEPSPRRPNIRRAADQAPRGRAGLMSVSEPWTPAERAPRGAARTDWL